MPSKISTYQPVHIRSIIKSTARSIKIRLDIKIEDIGLNATKQIVEIITEKDLFYYEGREAQKILDEIEKLSKKYGLNERTCLLYYLNSAGVFNDK